MDGPLQTAGRHNDDLVADSTTSLSFPRFQFTVTLWRDTVRSSGETGCLKMKRLLIGSLLLLLSPLSETCAAGLHDGDWTGPATSSSGARCRAMTVTLTVEGRVATGRARFEREAPNIMGTVSEDGTFGATIGFQPRTGKFIENEFEGAFKSSDCEWKILLKRTK